MRTRRVITAAAALVAPLLVVPLAGPAVTAGAADGPLASSIAVDWQRIAIDTIYTKGGSAPPLGTLYLSFTSLAVHDAAVRAQRHGSHAAAAAVATAAHDVLLEYFPASQKALDENRTASLARVRDGRAETLGKKIGAEAAHDMVLSRKDDGRFDSSITYTNTAALGVWPAAPIPGGMALAWLGFVDPVVDVEPVTLDGPDPVESDAYAADFEEVRKLGAKAASGTDRDAEQTAIAEFFSTNPVLMYRYGLCDLLAAQPLGLLPTTRLFARIDAAVATTMIETWRLKYTVGFWRPFQAIAAAEDDGNAGTHAHPLTWEPLIANPPYSDYTSGHAAGTSPFAEVLRQTLGDDTALTLKGGASTRTYASLTALEHDAFHARIWGGLHFRDAMEDGYLLGHTTADRVMHVVR